MANTALARRIGEEAVVIQMYLVTNLCDHLGRDQDLVNYGDRLVLSCRICGRAETIPFKLLNFTKVKKNACLRMIKLDFSPYMGSSEASPKSTP